ncbi:hypothetical protein AVEN_166189-1 [Araneus ventricosus]|uniref:Uncharacterized protein n=1 Tax=Araneus ventricosus TaxID=182803 RepID=A0A4Y2DBE5_ARAVE|nr:hypothetical protein AVEN_166189-1 [Araneus ventricosus]
MHGRRASCEPLDGAVMESIKREFSDTSPFLPWISEGMAAYSNQEKADMHFMYDLANAKDLEAKRPYMQRSPRRHVTDQSDCIDDCVKRDPLSPACMIQSVAGVFGRRKL